MKIFQMNNKKLFFIKILIAVIIFLTLFYKIGFNNIYDTLISINPLYLFLLIFFTLFIMVIETITYKILTLGIDNKIPFWKLFKYYLASWSIGLVSPGKIGEFSLVYYLKKEGIDIGKGTAIYILDKSITVFLLILISIYGFFTFLTNVQAIRLIIILLVLSLIVIFFLVSSVGRRILVKYILRSYAKKFDGFSKTLFFYIKDRKRIVLLDIFLTLIKTVLQALAVYFVFLAFNIKVPVLSIYIISAIVTIVGLIPITISGLGTREASAVFLYSLISIKAPVVIGVYITIIFVHYLIGLIYTLFFLKTL